MNLQQTPAKYLAALLSAAFLMFPSSPRLAAAEPSNRLKNGDFEQIENDQPSGWKMDGKVKSEKISGVWQRLTCKFNSGDQDAAHFCFAFTTGSFGSVWIDNLALYEKLPNDRIAVPKAVQNASFEECASDGGLAQWLQDDRNVTIFSDPARASDGKRSVRITHVNDAVPWSRITQKFPVKRNQEYELAFDLLVGDDFQGEARGLIFDEKANSCIMSNYGQTSASPLVEIRDRCDQYAARLTSTTEAPSEISQEVAVKPDMNLQAGVDLDNRAFQGVVRFLVEDAASGEVLNRAEVQTVRAEWQRLRMSFGSQSSKLRVRVRAEGEGELQVDNASVGSPTISPPLQKVAWLSAGENFAFPSQLEASVQGPSGQALEGGLQLLRADLKKQGVELAQTESDQPPLRLLIGEKYAVKGKGPEAYVLTVNPRGITIKAGQEAGAFYALMTLLQLLDQRNGQPVALACKITDYPDMPLRGILYGDPEPAARWKMNTVMYSTGYPTRAAEREDLHKFVRECERLNQKVIPYFITLAAGSYVEGKNPNLAAGVWVKDEKLTLHGTTPSNLANQCVIRTKLTDVEVRSLDGKTPYRLGQDYQILNGEMGLPYDPTKLKPFAVARMPGSAIPDEATVLASYDYVSRYRSSTNRTQAQIPYCPLEPEARELMAEHMTNLARDYPFEYFNTGCCLGEFRDAESQLETDSRVIKSGKRPIELLAEEVGWLDRAAKAGNPKARTLQWACELNEYCRVAGPKLPKDALINVWGYDPSWPSKYGREALTFWSQLGFTTVVMPWNNLRNVRAWAQVVAEAVRRGHPCIGMIDSCWGNSPNSGTPNPTGGMRETACVSWKIPKKGEKGYVPVE